MRYITINDIVPFSPCMTPENTETQAKNNAYSMKDAMQIAEDIFNLSKEKTYHPGAFIHGLIIVLEATQQTYQIPPKELAEVKRGVRRYLSEVSSQMEKNQSV